MYFRSSSDILAGRTKSVQIDIAILELYITIKINNLINKGSILNMSNYGMVSSGLITYNNRARGVIISGMVNFTPRISVRFYWIGPK